MNSLADEVDALLYAVSKQVDTGLALETSYGRLALDEELRQAVARAIKPIIKARIAAGLKQLNESRHE